MVNIQSSSKYLLACLFLASFIFAFPQKTHAVYCNDTASLTQYSQIAGLTETQLNACCYAHDAMIGGVPCPDPTKRPQGSVGSVSCVTNAQIIAAIQNAWKQGKKYDCATGALGAVWCAVDFSFQPACFTPTDGTACSSTNNYCCKQDFCNDIYRSAGTSWCTGSAALCDGCLSGYDPPASPDSNHAIACIASCAAGQFRDGSGTCVGINEITGTMLTIFAKMFTISFPTGTLTLQSMITAIMPQILTSAALTQWNAGTLALSDIWSNLSASLNLPNMGGSAPVFVGVSTDAYTASLTDYNHANLKCSVPYGTGAHICSIDEMLFSYKDIDATGALTNTALSGATGGAWINGGPPGYYAPLRDCKSWTVITSAELGRFWDFSSTPDEAKITDCASGVGAGYKFACCK